MKSNSVLHSVVVFYVKSEDLPFKICEYYDMIINNFCLMKRIGNAVIFLIHITILEPNIGVPFFLASVYEFMLWEMKGLIV
jgi:hypothetical protein